MPKDKPRPPRAAGVAPALPNKPALTRQRIVDAALRIASDHGTDALSLRGVARELGVTPMALYRHVPSKQVLMDEVRVLQKRAKVRVATPLEEPLSMQQVVDEALQLVAEQGLSGLSMRTLARRLSVTPMTIYRHVDNKRALLSAMTDAILDDLPHPEATPDNWEACFREHAHQVWARFAAYPGLVGSFARGPSTRVLDHMAYERRALLVGGADPHTASMAITVYHTFMLGLLRTHSYLDWLTHVDGNPTGIDPSLIRRYGERLRLTDLLDLALDGVVATVRAATAASGPADP